MVLVIADVALTGVDGPAFVTLRELASVPAADGGESASFSSFPN